MSSLHSNDPLNPTCPPLSEATLPEKHDSLGISAARAAIKSVCLEPCRLDGSVIGMPNLALFSGTPFLAHQFEDALVSEFFGRQNLAHVTCRTINQKYLKLLSEHYRLEGVNLGISAITPSGTTANAGAIEIIHRFAEETGKNRLGVICSEGAHSSVKRIPRMPHYFARLNDENQFDISDIKKILKKHKPAAIVMTSPRTEDGIIEQVPPELNELLLNEGVMRVRDCVLGGIVPLFNDTPMYEGDPKPGYKQRFMQCLKSGQFDFLVCGISKHLGAANIASIICSDNLPIELNAIIKEEFNLVSSGGNDHNYFEGGGSYGSTTIEPTSAVLTIRMLQSVDISTKRLLALNAVSTAERLKESLSDLGVTTGPAHINFVAIYLKDHDEVKRVKMILRGCMIEAAECNTFNYGIKLIIPLDQVIEDHTIAFVSNAIRAAIDGQSIRAIFPEKSGGTLPEHYVVEMLQLEALNRYYNDSEFRYDRAEDISEILCNAYPELIVDPLSYINYDRAQATLSILHMRFSCSADILSRALESMFIGIYFPPKLEDCSPLMEFFLRSMSQQTGDRQGNDWNEKLRVHADHLARSSQLIAEAGSREAKEQIFIAFADTIIKSGEEVVRDWYAEARPVPRLDINIESICHILGIKI